MRLRLALFVASLSFAGCSFDLSIPEAPSRGRIVGSVDTGKHVPLEGQRVDLAGADGAQLNQTTTATGSFVFTDLPPGIYTVALAIPGFAKFSSGIVRVKGGQDTDLGVLTPDWLQNTPQEATLTGLVTSTSGGDVTGTKVEFMLGTTPIAQVTVSADGAFVARLPPGTFLLRATNPAYVTFVSEPVVLKPAENKDISKAPLVLDVNPATLNGTVFEERDGAAAVASSGALITIETGQTTTVDATGHFQLTGLPAGVHQVRAGKAGLHDGQPSHPITLTAGNTSTLDKISLLIDRGNIIGTVIMADRAPATGARVEVSGTRYAALVAPDSTDPSQGVFIITAVPVGQWTVTARKDQYSTSSAMVTLTTDAPADTGTLTLARLQGDFLIDDGDATNVYGYTRTRAVTLDFDKFPSTGVTSYRASEDGSFDGGVFLPYTGSHQRFTLSPGEGVHTVYAQYQDTSGQVSQGFTSNVVLDTIAPVVTQVDFEATGVSGMTKYTNVSQSLRLKVQAGDGTGGSGVSKMAVGEAVDGTGKVVGPGSAAQSYQVDAVLTRSVTTDGAQAVYVQVSDLAGNLSTAGTDTITVDVAKPTGNITIARGTKATDDGYTSSPLVNITETFSDGVGGSAVLVKLANSPSDLDSAVYQTASSATGWFLNPQSEGLKTVYARFRDIAGNESTDALSTVTYDVTPPTPAAISLITPAITNSAVVTLQLTTNPADLSSTQALTLSDESSFTGSASVGPSVFPVSGQSPFTLSAGDGARTIYARFRDKAGNDSVASTQVTLDTQLPTGSFTITGALADGTPSSTATSTNVVTITIAAGGATQFRLSDSTMTSCPTTGYSPLVATVLANQTLPANGIVTLCLRDDATNTQALLTQSIILDTTAPTGCSLGAAGKKTDGVTAAPVGKTGVRQITVTVSACAGATEMAVLEGAVTCSSSSLSWVPFTTTASLVLGGADGARPIVGCVRDVARNVAPLTPAGIVLDTTAPVGPNVSIDGHNQYINLAQTVTRGGNVGFISGSAVNAVEWAITEDTSVFPAWSPIAVTAFTFSGTGQRTIFAKFRDDVGNETTAVYDSVTIDLTPPSLTGVTLTSVPSVGAQAGFVNDALAGFELAGVPSDAVGGQVAQSPGVTCPASVFSAALIRGVLTSFTFSLLGGDGPKTLCVQLYDAAGNPSGSLAPLSVTLDTTPPTAPVITTTPRGFNIAQASSGGLPAFTVNTTAPGVTELNFQRYERAGGNYAVWTTNGGSDTNRTSTSFTYSLQADRSNTLRLRAVDKAGNVSTEDTVTISWDNTRPSPPVMKGQWVDNASSRSTVYWQASPSTDVTNYRVHYGPTQGTTSVTPPIDFTGSNAVEGPSPILVPSTGAADQALALTGLTNSSVSYVTVTALDAAGNESSAPAVNTDLPNRQAILEPNEVSLNRVAQLAISTAGINDAVVIVGHRAYLAGHTNNGCVVGQSTLTALDLSVLTSALSLGHIVASPGVPTVTAGPTQFADSLGCSSSQPVMVDLVADGQWLFMGSGSKVRIFSLANPGVPALTTTIDVGVSFVQQLALIGDRLFISATPSVVALNLKNLYDADSTTVPTAADIIGTVTVTPAMDVDAMWVSGMNISRDRMVQFTNNGGENLSYLLTSALGAAPTFSTAANYIAVTGDYLSGQVLYRKQLTSGNYLYTSDDVQFSVFNLKKLWGSTTAGPGISTTDLVTQLSSAGGGAFDIQGSEGVVVDRNGSAMRVLDMSNSAGVSEASYLSTASLRTPVMYGNYVVVGGYGLVQFFETATPRSMHEVSSVASGAASQTNDVSPGLLFTGNGVTYDLHRSSSLAPISPALHYPAANVDVWAYDMARYENMVVSAQGQGFMLFDAAKQTDRDPSTNWSLADGPSTIFTDTTRRATGLAAYGNFLFASEVRSDGIWIEVFDARRLRNPQAGTFDINTQSKGSFQVAAITTTNSMWATITVVDGRAIIGIDDHAFLTPPPATGLYVVDIRPMVDDSAVGTASVLASLLVTAVHQTAVRGGWLYAATIGGLTIVDIKEVMDENPLTTLPASPARVTTLATTPMDAVATYGSYLFEADRFGYNIRALDVLAPLTPVVVSVIGGPVYAVSGYATIEAAYGPSVKPARRAISVRGSRLFSTAYNETRIIELE